MADGGLSAACAAPATVIRRRLPAGGSRSVAHNATGLTAGKVPTLPAVSPDTGQQARDSRPLCQHHVGMPRRGGLQASCLVTRDFSCPCWLSLILSAGILLVQRGADAACPLRAHMEAVGMSAGRHHELILGGQKSGKTVRAEQAGGAAGWRGCRRVVRCIWPRPGRGMPRCRTRIARHQQERARRVPRHGDAADASRRVEPAGVPALLREHAAPGYGDRAGLPDAVADAAADAAGVRAPGSWLHRRRRPGQLPSRSKLRTRRAMRPPQSGHPWLRLRRSAGGHPGLARPLVYREQ